MEFSILAEMIQHKVVCLKVCKVCNKSFNRMDKFSGHMRAHNTMNRRME